MKNALEFSRKLQEIMLREPLLNYFGIGIYTQKRKSTAENAIELEKKRFELIDTACNSFETYQWLVKNIRPIKTINRKQTSYTYKHIVERRLGRYVSNGELIAAALIAGYKSLLADGGPNVYFAMSQEDWKRFSAD